MSKKKIFLSLFILSVIALIIVNPKQNIASCLDGTMLWAKSIMPALFPFFFLTSLLSELGLILKLGNAFSPLTKKLYKTSGISGYIFAMSIISGYPVGAKITAELYEKGVLSKGQASKTTTFTSTSGPLFIVGTVGANMFDSSKLGYLILLCHILGAFINGILYRNTFLEKQPEILITSIKRKNVLEDTMYGAIKSVLIVGGYIVVFFMIINMINRYNLLYPLNSFLALITHSNISTTRAITNGIIEVTRGCLDLSVLGLSRKKALVFCTGLISFGGISIIMQALTFLKRFNISTWFFIKSKITQTIISVLIALLFTVFV